MMGSVLKKDGYWEVHVSDVYRFYYSDPHHSDDGEGVLEGGERYRLDASQGQGLMIWEKPKLNMPPNKSLYIQGDIDTHPAELKVYFTDVEGWDPDGETITADFIPEGVKRLWGSGSGRVKYLASVKVDVENKTVHLGDGEIVVIVPEATLPGGAKMDPVSETSI